LASDKEILRLVSTLDGLASEALPLIVASKSILHQMLD
jgi:hypothetical protein